MIKPVLRALARFVVDTPGPAAWELCEGLEELKDVRDVVDGLRALEATPEGVP